MLVAALLAAAAALGAANASDGVCTLNIWTDLNTPKEPLILEVSETRDHRETLKLIFPTDVVHSGSKTQGVLHVSEGKKLLAACTGDKNSLEGSREQSGYIKCSNGKLSINGRPANEDSLSCKKDAAKSFVKKTTEKCGLGENEGTKFIVGFTLTDDKEDDFFPMIEVCHNTEKMVSYYSSHQLYGKSLEGAVKYSGRPKFSGDGSFDGVNPDWAYKQTTQHEAFDAALGKGAGDVLDKTIFLARGHLAPDADFIYNSGQQLTYYYINAAPQWQTFNAYNWLKIENAARKLASMEEATLNVWTGTYGILKLPDKNNNDKEVYLSPKELPRPGKRGRRGKKQEESDEANKDLIPVPEVFWKIVQHPTEKSCTVAVGHNNVFLEEEPTPICDKVAVDGWPTRESLPLDRGFVYYCTYQSFKKTVDYVPDIDCTDLFAFPKNAGKKQ